MAPTTLRQAETTNSGLALLDRPALLRARSAYRRLLRQIENDPLSADSIAEDNVRRYLAELDEALAAREEAVA